jgi:hypothetical protein
MRNEALQVKRGVARWFGVSWLVLVALTLSVSNYAQRSYAQSAGVKQTAAAEYGKLPLSFEANEGQADRSVEYLSRGRGYAMALRPGQMALRLRGGAGSGAAAVEMTLVDANDHAVGQAEERQVTRTNYLLGADPAKWHRDVPNFGRVRYAGVYPGIDLVYYGNQRRLEHDFVVAAGADAGRIVFSIGGAEKLSVDESSGDLVIGVGAGEVRLLRPVSYQPATEGGGGRTEVESGYRLLGANRVGFELGRYDHGRPLVIDPVLVYSTFLGGTNVGTGDKANGIAVDSHGNAYVVGTAYSTDFPLATGAYQTTDGALTKGWGTAFISKLSPDGTSLVYSTFLGGSGSDFLGDTGIAIAVDSAGDAFVTGNTGSMDFPVTGGVFSRSYANVFLTKLNPAGNGLLYSTFVGNGTPAAMVADGSGNVYLTGSTSDAHFPVTPGAFQTVNHAASIGLTNAFVTKVNAAGSALVYSTLLGGSGGAQFSDLYDHATELAIDSSGDAFVTGAAASDDFPVTAGAYQTVKSGVSGNSTNAFVSKFDPTGSSLLFSTFLAGPGGSGPGTAIALDSAGRVVVAGNGDGISFPTTAGAFETGVAGAFVCKLNATGSALVWSTGFGATYDLISGMALDASDTIYLAGTTYLNGALTTEDAVAAIYPVTSNPTSQFGVSNFQGFVAKMASDGTALQYGSLLGDGLGIVQSFANGLVLDGAGNVLVTGTATSGGFPISPGAFQTTNHAHNSYVTKLALGAETKNHSFSKTSVVGPSASVQFGQTVTITITVAPGTSGPVPTGKVELFATVAPTTTSQIILDLDDSGSATWTSSTLATGNYGFQAVYLGDANYTTSQAPPSPTETAPVSFSVLGKPAFFEPLGDQTERPIVYGSPVGHPLQLQLYDANSNTLAGITVNFSGAGLGFSPTPAVTDANGIVTVTPIALAAGNLTISAIASGMTTPYVFPAISVSPAPYSIYLSNSYRFYGAPNPALSYRTSGTLYNGDVLAVNEQTTATVSSPVGVYPITATIGGPAAGNYTVALTNASMQVLKAPLRVQPQIVNVTYGSPIPTPTVYKITGFVNGDTQSGAVTGTPQFHYSVPAGSPVGIYPLTLTQGTLASSNYFFQFFAYSVEIYREPLTYTIQNVTIHQGDPIPAFTYTWSGFVNGDTAAVITGQPLLTTTATSSSPPGKYVILGFTGTLASNNYGFAPKYGTLTILR